MLRWFLLALLIVPVSELLLLWLLGSQLGFWPLIAMLLFSAVLGVVLARREGLRVIRSYREAIKQLRLPDEGLIDGLLVLAGGALFAFPGVLTDIAAIVLLIPRTRRVVAQHIRAVIDKKIKDGLARVMVQSPLGNVSSFMGDDGYERESGPRGFHVEWRDVSPPSSDDFAARGSPFNRGEVIDTEGVEVQDVKLLGPAPSQDKPRRD